MGRPQGKDRGLVLRKTKDGIRYWRVRLWHNGRDVTFQPFRYKHEAKQFYRHAKRLQAKGLFVPQDFQTGRKGKREPNSNSENR